MGIVTSAMARGPRGAQEDRFTVLSLRDGWLLAVFDGHNGNAVSDFCAKRLPSLALEVWKKSQANDDEYYFLRTIIQILHKETRRRIAGSTVTLAHVREEDDRLDVAILGDSPAIVHTNGSLWVSNEHNVRSNAIDSKLMEERGADIDHGYMCIECEGFLDKCIQLTRALGDKHFNKYLIREPECSSFSLDSKSVVAIMSDGVYDPSVLCRPSDLLTLPIKNAQTIVDGALRRGTHDNVTAVVWRA